MRLVIAVSMVIGIARADTPSSSSITLEDLEARSLTALKTITRAHLKSEAEAQAVPLRLEFERLLRFDRMRDGGSMPALVLQAESLVAPAPAIIILYPHNDPAEAPSQEFARALAEAGFIVLQIDERANHASLELLPDGVSPDSLIHHSVRAAIEYLLARKDVDSRRVGLLGDGLSATLAAALDPRLSAVVLKDAAPDLEQVVTQFKALRGDDLPDACYLVPGLARHATQEMMSLIAPRPLLLISPAQTVFDYTYELYSSFGAHVQQADSEAGVLAWLREQLQGTVTPLSERTLTRTVITLPGVSVGPGSPVSTADLARHLGELLPQGQIHWMVQLVHASLNGINTQVGFTLPAITYRLPTPESVGTAVMIAISDDGAEALDQDEVVQEAGRRQYAIWAFDVRGLGKMKVENRGAVFVLSMWLEECVAWRQSRDLEHLMTNLRDAYSGRPMALYARGPNSSVIAALIAATSSTNFPNWIAIRGGAASFWDKMVPFFVSPVGMRGILDLPGLVRSSAAPILTITDLDQFLRADW